MIRLYFLLACALVVPPRVLSSQPPTSIDSLLLLANERLTTGDTAAALAVLEEATDRAPRHVEALYQRGRLLVRTISLGFSDTPRQVLAWRLLNRGSDLAPGDARFTLELGRLRLRTPLLGADAERFFRNAANTARAAGDNTTAAEALWELGFTFERRYRTSRHRYMYTGSIFFDQFAARGRLNYVRDFLEQQVRPIEDAGASERLQAEQRYREALEADPRHVPSAIGLFGLLIDQRRFDELSSRADALLAGPMPEPTLWFAAGLASLRLGDVAAAEYRFNEGLARLSPQERAEILNIGRLLTPGDSVRLAGAAPTVRAATTTAFWETADPLLSTSQNEAQLEYFARIAVTMLRFDEPARGVRGWRTDRGQIIVRYGEPPIEALLPPTDNLTARDAAGRVITVFYYPKSEAAFVFSGALAMGGAVFSGDFRDVADGVREKVPFRLDNVPLTAEVDSVAVQVARFRAKTANAFTVVLAASVPVTAMYRGVELDRGALALSYRQGAQERMQLVDSQHVDLSLPIQSPLEYRRIVNVPSGAMRFRVEAVDPTVRGASSRAQVALELPPFVPTEFALSDALLARRRDREASVMREYADAHIEALASTRLAPRDTFAVYVEAYAALPDSEDNVHFDVELIVTLLEIERTGDRVSRWLADLADLAGFTAEGDRQLGMRFSRVERLAGRDRVPLLVALGLGEMPVGRYRLDVTLKDRTAQKLARTSREFTISRR